MNKENSKITREKKEPTILNIRLRELREQTGETQQDIASLFQLKDNKIISWYENTGAMPPFDRLKILAKHFNVSLDYLYGLTDDKKTLEIEKSISTNGSKLSGRALKNLNTYIASQDLYEKNRLKTVNKLLEDPILLDTVASLINYKK